MKGSPGVLDTLNRGPNHSLGISKEGYVKPTRTCAFPGCDKPLWAKSLCNGHWQQQHKGKELRPLRSQITLEQRFWVKVKKTPSCWVWTAPTTSDGYGRVWVGGCMRLAHRLSWEIINGSIPDNMELDHRCGNHACVNPAHLRPTTHSQNMQHRIGNQRNNTSGVRGVTWSKDKNAWRAQAWANGRRYHGGYHSTLEAAETTAKALRAKLHTHDDHDEWLKKQKDTL